MPEFQAVNKKSPATGIIAILLRGLTEDDDFSSLLFSFSFTVLLSLLSFLVFPPGGLRWTDFYFIAPISFECASCPQMSFHYAQDGRRHRVVPGAAFDAAARQRSFMGYWMPLVLTVGVATIGIAAWIWSEQGDEDDDYYPRRDYDDSGDESYPTPPPGCIPPSRRHRGDVMDPVEPGTEPYTTSSETGLYRDLPDQPDDSGMLARMQGALRRTPSPQEIFGGASKRVAAGMAAAGAFVGLSTIREEGRGDFEDHTRWSEEVESRNNENNRRASSASQAVMSGALSSSRGIDQSKTRKSVVIVVSSVVDGTELDHAARLLLFSPFEL